MNRVTLKTNAKLEYRRAAGNGEALRQLLNDNPSLKYREYYESRRAGDLFEVEFETTREGVPMLVLSEVLSGGALSARYHYLLPQSDFKELFSASRITACCEDE